MTQSIIIKTIRRHCRNCDKITEQEKQGIGKESRYVCLDCLMDPDTKMRPSGKAVNMQGRLF